MYKNEDITLYLWSPNVYYVYFVIILNFNILFLMHYNKKNNEDKLLCYVFNTDMPQNRCNLQIGGLQISNSSYIPITYMYTHRSTYINHDAFKIFTIL